MKLWGLALPILPDSWQYRTPLQDSWQSTLPPCKILGSTGPLQASHASTRTHAPHDAAHVAAAHMISRRSAPCFRRGESAAFDRIRTAIVRHRRDTGRDLRPRSRCTPGLSCAADARACSELGSRAKFGLGARRSPQKAVSHRRRTERRLAIAQRSRSASAHLCRRAHEQLQPGAAPGCNPPFVTLSLGLDPEGHRA